MAPDSAGQVYDKIGTGDTARRQADSRLARLLFAALGLGRVPNVGLVRARMSHRAAGSLPRNHLRS